ncbi:MAG: 2-hydroxyacyl-CoA dehydratase [Firmicutes bacterium]|nr:2-hydroxyacyl-CoA dehydratase [Bacillota bacterium]
MKLTEIKSQLDYIKYSRNIMHSYSRGVQKLFDLAVSYIYDAEKAFHQGKSVIWTWGLWEAPLIYACDTIPVAFTELGRLGSQEAVTISEDYFQVPRESCSMVKATLGEWYLRRGNGINRMLGFSASCEPYNVALELMKNEGYDVHHIDTVYLPPDYDQARYEHILQYFISEIHAAARWLTGRELDEEKLTFEIKRRNTFIKKVRRIMDLRLQNPFYIKSLPTMFLLMGSGHYFGKPEEYSEVLDLLITELEDARTWEQPYRVIPLLWTGGRGQEFGVYKAIDDSGGAILGWVIPTPFARDFQEDLPAAESLARYLLDGQLAGASVYKRHIIEDQIKKSNAKGIILYGYVGCSFSGVEREMEREYFHQKGIPSISLEGTFQVGPPSGQLLTRVKAFVEMLS